MILFLAMTEAQRGEAFANGLTRLIVFGVLLALGLRFVISTVRGSSGGNSPADEVDDDPKNSANNDPSRSGRPRF